MSKKVLDSISSDLFGKKVTLKGIALDSKGGAVLKLKDQVIYVKEWEDWESELLNKTITITGTLVQKKFIPDPVVAKDGAISQGAEGSQIVLENYTLEE